MLGLSFGNVVWCEVFSRIIDNCDCYLQSLAECHSPVYSVTGRKSTKIFAARRSDCKVNVML